MAEKHLYKFRDFVLDPDEKTLESENGRVSLTPKVFELLFLFLQNRGKLISKDEILGKVWAGSFVEESNLTYTINQLRKLLNDNARQPIFIETIPRRGYRFIADVEEISSEPSEVPSRANLQTDSKRRYLLLIPLAALLVSAIVVVAYWNRSEPSASILTKPFGLEKINDSADSGSAVISPSGKFVIYSIRTGKKNSLWRKQLETGENIEIVAPTDAEYAELYVAKDEETLLFARRQSEKMDIYQMSILGGIPKKILDNTEGVFGVSPDETQISFVRCPRQKSIYCSLLTANIDGTNEKTLVTKEQPFVITDNEFSPAENSIVFAEGQSTNGSREFSLSKVFWETGKTIDISAKTFFRIQRIVCLPESNNYLVSGRTDVSDNSKIWLVDEMGNFEALTKDSSNYLGLSLDTKADKLVATQIAGNFYLNLSDLDNPLVLNVLTDAIDSVTFSPSGKIIYGSNLSGSQNLWEINADGSGKRQLTNSRRNSMPLASRDGRYIFFTSNNTGEYQVWRMNADGSNQIRITKNEGGYPLGFSPDGTMLYFRSALLRNIWQVPIDGGDETILFDQPAIFYEISPDGTRLATYKEDGEKRSLIIQLLSTQQIEKEFPFAPEHKEFGEIAWSPDGRFLLYAASKDKAASLWRQNLDSSNPTKVTDLGTNEIAQIAIAPDNKSFAVTRGNWASDTVLINGFY